MYIAHAMQHLAAYLINNNNPSAVADAPQAGERTRDPGPSSSSLGGEGGARRRATSLVGKSRSRGRRVSFKLDEDIVDLDFFGDEGSSRARARGESDDEGGRGSRRWWWKADADADGGERERRSLAVAVDSDDDGDGLVTPIIRGGRYRRAQTPGPPSPPAAPENHPRSRSLPRHWD